MKVVEESKKITEQELQRVRKIESGLIESYQSLGDLSTQYEFAKQGILSKINDSLGKRNDFMKELSEVYGDNLLLDIGTGELKNKEE